MDIYIYRLRFNGPTHFGETGIDLENVREYVSSDTLFSALINAGISNGICDNKFIDRFKESPPFLISSLFLFTNDIYFLPRPMDDSHISSELKRKMGKELKKLKWIDLEGFKKWIRWDHLTEDDIKEMELQSKKYKEAFEIEIRPRVTLDRITQSSNIYHCGYIYFQPYAGLYGLVAFNDLSFIEKFKELLTVLGETGLGGERTYGCGMFKVEFERVSGTLKDILEATDLRYTLLSLYHPSQDEKDDISINLIAYEITRKKGWITTGRYALPLKRKSVGFITEGSVLHKQPKGCLVDVTPDNIPTEMLSHKVYRYGYAFTAPMKGFND
jgi:CRISPR-associated protein Csm4